jgi:hypothetical protein
LHCESSTHAPLHAPEQHSAGRLHFVPGTLQVEAAAQVPPVHTLEQQSEAAEQAVPSAWQEAPGDFEPQAAPPIRRQRASTATRGLPGERMARIFRQTYDPEQMQSFTQGAMRVHASPPGATSAAAGAPRDQRARAVRTTRPPSASK